MRRPVISRRGLVATALALVATSARGSTTTIQTADGRPVKISIWDAVGRERGLIVFSHGALSSPEKYAPLLSAWARAGFRVLAPLHVDSADHPDHARYATLLESWRCRILDMRALAAVAGAHGYVAAGHSYGALTALTLGGAEPVAPPGVIGPLRDPGARIVVAFSPPGPSPGLISFEGYARLAVPALIETGTADNPPEAMGGGGYQSHLAAYEAAAPGDRYALVLDGVDHYFGGLICRPELPGPHQSAGLANAIAITGDFLEGYGLGDTSARRRLDGAVGVQAEFVLSRK